jgi:hypothetical protein
MITVQDVRTYAGADPSDDAFIELVLAEAQALVAAHVGSNDVPVSVMDNCVVQVARELWFRRNAPAGITQIASFDGSGMRISNDPLNSVYPLLDKFVMRGI